MNGIVPLEKEGLKMRLVDADDFLKRLAVAPMIQEAMRKAFNHMPTVDAVEVVRCKDCKYADSFAECKFVSWYNNKDDFCSRGERREDVKTDCL